MWYYYPNGYIISVLCEERERNKYEVAVLRYFERGPENVLEKIKRKLRGTRFASSEFLDVEDLPSLPIKPEYVSGMICYRFLTSKEVEWLKEFIKILPRPKDLTLTITGTSGRFTDDSKIEWNKAK